MKLPRILEMEGIDSEIQKVLAKKSVELFEGSKFLIPDLKLNPELRKQLIFAKLLEQVVIGYGAVEKALGNELHGLQNVNNKSQRISRLLFVTNDGSPRFYRELEFLRNRHGERVLICRLDVDSVLMGEILELKNKQVKAILLNRKDSVIKVLKSLV